MWGTVPLNSECRSGSGWFEWFCLWSPSRFNNVPIVENYPMGAGQQTLVGKGKVPLARQRSGCSPWGPYGEEVMVLPTPQRLPGQHTITSKSFGLVIWAWSSTKSIRLLPTSLQYCISHLWISVSSSCAKVLDLFLLFWVVGNEFCNPSQKFHGFARFTKHEKHKHSHNQYDTTHRGFESSL